MDPVQIPIPLYRFATSETPVVGRHLDAAMFTAHCAPIMATPSDVLVSVSYVGSVVTTVRFAYSEDGIHAVSVATASIEGTGNHAAYIYARSVIRRLVEIDRAVATDMHPGLLRTIAWDLSVRAIQNPSASVFETPAGIVHIVRHHQLGLWVQSPTQLSPDVIMEYAQRAL